MLGAKEAVVVDETLGHSDDSKNTQRRWGLRLSESGFAVDNALWVTLGVVFILWGVRLWGANTTVPILVVPALLSILWGLGVVVWHGGSGDSRYRNFVLFGSVILFCGVFLFWTYFQILQFPSYGTDEMAFDQYAAQLLVHGLNPYNHSMAPSFNLYQVSPNGYTWSVKGTPVTSLSYPALSFLVYVPFMLLGLYSQLAVWVNAFAWVLTVVLAFFLTPKSARGFVLIISSLSIYVTYAVGGVTDVLFLPMLVVVAFTWKRFVTSDSKFRFLIPVLFGFAMSVKQTPWLVLPFIVIAIVHEEYQYSKNRRAAIKKAGSFFAFSIGAFMLTNLPFLLQDPGAWLRGIETPFVGSNVPAGEGLISLSLFLHIGGGSLFAFTVLGSCTLLFVLALFALKYNAFSGWLFVLPSIPLALTSRSFGSYLVMLVIPGLVDQTSGVKLVVPPVFSKRELGFVASGVLLVGAVGIYALTKPSPLSLTISSIHTSGQLATVDKVQVTLDNHTSGYLSPSFTADEGGSLTAFWQVLSGPNLLRPHSTASFTLGAPNFYAMPSLTGGFQIVAFTSSGSATISHSGAYVPTLWHLVLNPDAVDHVVRYGHNVTFSAQIVDEYNIPVHASGVAVYMGQIIYAQRGLIFGEATINQGNAGQTPVVALTNKLGVATFTITDLVKEPDPIYFEANLVNSKNFYPYGYSQIVPVRFQ